MSLKPESKRWRRKYIFPAKGNEHQSSIPQVSTIVIGVAEVSTKYPDLNKNKCQLLPQFYMSRSQFPTEGERLCRVSVKSACPTSPAASNKRKFPCGIPCFYGMSWRDNRYAACNVEGCINSRVTIQSLMYDSKCLLNSRFDDRESKEGHKGNKLQICCKKLRTQLRWI